MTEMDAARRAEAEEPLGETPGFDEWAEEIVSLLRARREEGATIVSGVEYAAPGERPEPPERPTPRGR